MKDRSRNFHGLTCVFDLDGTLADTAPDLIDAATSALLDQGFPRPEPEAIRKHVGYGSRAMIRAALASTGARADHKTIEGMKTRLIDYYENNIAVKTALFPGARQALHRIRGDGAKLLVCTSKRERLARKLLAALEVDDLFDALAGGDSFTFCKPDPRHITEFVRLSGRDLRNTLMIGDSEADIDAAKGAGVPVIAVAFGYAAVSANQLGADAILDHFEHLPSLIAKLTREKSLILG
jgi:phosphoglycolate phosphatase